MLYSKALEVASKSICRFKLGALVLKGKRTISEGYNNQYRTVYYPGFGKVNTCHAEISALMELCRKLHVDFDFRHCYGNLSRVYGKYNMLVVRTEMKTSKPCKCCLFYLQLFGMKKITYSMNGLTITSKSSMIPDDHPSTFFRQLSL